MKVLDGRNPHAVPKVIELSEFLIRNKYDVSYVGGPEHYVYDLQLDGLHVYCDSLAKPARSREGDSYRYVLCTAYKTERGLENAVRRMYEHARKITGE